MQGVRVRGFDFADDNGVQRSAIGMGVLDEEIAVHTTGGDVVAVLSLGGDLLRTHSIQPMHGRESAFQLATSGSHAAVLSSHARQPPLVEIWRLWTPGTAVLSDSVPPDGEPLSADSNSEGGSMSDLD